jgi:hypothetical protein
LALSPRPRPRPRPRSLHTFPLPTFPFIRSLPVPFPPSRSRPGIRAGPFRVRLSSRVALRLSVFARSFVIRSFGSRVVPWFSLLAPFRSFSRSSTVGWHPPHQRSVSASRAWASCSPISVVLVSFRLRSGSRAADSCDPCVFPSSSSAPSSIRGEPVRLGGRDPLTVRSFVRS